MWYCKKYLDYPLYGKTGTTDWGDSGVEFGIPVSSTKDSWLVMQTNKYTISCWTGYDELAPGSLPGSWNSWRRITAANTIRMCLWKCRIPSSRSRM